MELENIIQYLLIGNLKTKKIIYEMQNTIDSNILYEIKQLFNTYSIKKNLREENTKVESYYINISVEKIIMISKTNTISFSLEQNYELFEKIKKNVPELDEIPLESRKRRHKQSLNSKITNIIYDFFQYINANKQIISENYFKIKSKEPNKIITRNNNKNTVNNKINFKKSLINVENNKSIDYDKSSTRQIINTPIKIISKEQEENIYNQYFKHKKNKNEKEISEKKGDKLSKIVLNENNGLDNIDNINISRTFYQFGMNNSPEIILKEVENEIKKITCCRRFIIFILILIILIEITIIPIIIINVYSY